MYAGAALLGFGMFLGGIIASIIFLVESNKQFKLFCGKYGFLIDLLLFILSALAIAYLGVTVAGGLGVASLIFTVYRVSFLVPWYERNKVKARSIMSYLAEGFNSFVSSIKNMFA